MHTDARNVASLELHNGLLLGTREGRWVWSGAQRSSLVLGPTRAGKTTSIVIPNVLCATGAVVTTSTKPDVMHATSAARARAGRCLLFDPTGATPPIEGVQPIGWSPLDAAVSWDGAISTAQLMVTSSRHRSSAQAGATDHWTERSGALLASLLHAGALSASPMRTVLGWVDRHDGNEALERLGSLAGSSHPATALLEGIVATDSREQSGIWSTASGVLGAYRSLRALEATDLPRLDPEEFVRSPHTLYVCGPARGQANIAPLVVGMLAEIQSAAYRSTSLREPVVFALDELANIAPLPDLPQLVSEGGGQGVLTIGCLQDLSQARTRWGPEADGFLSLFSTTVVFGGIADVRTLRSLSDLTGQRDQASESFSMSRDVRGRRSTSRSTALRREPALPIDALARGRAGSALLLDASKRASWIELSMAHRDEPWRSVVTPPFRAIDGRDR